MPARTPPPANPGTTGITCPRPLPCVGGTAPAGYRACRADVLERRPLHLLSPLGAVQGAAGEGSGGPGPGVIESFDFAAGQEPGELRLVGVPRQHWATSGAGTVGTTRRSSRHGGGPTSAAHPVRRRSAPWVVGDPGHPVRRVPDGWVTWRPIRRPRQSRPGGEPAVLGLVLADRFQGRPDDKFLPRVTAVNDHRTKYSAKQSQQVGEILALTGTRLAGSIRT